VHETDDAETIAEHARTVRLPLNKLSLLKDISKVSRRLGQGRESEPGVEEIAAELDVPAEEILDTMLSARTVRSLDEAFEEDDERNELRDMLNKRYAAQRRTTFTEASSFVFDTARELMKREHIFDTSKLPAKELDRYGRTELGQHMLVARNMLEAGVRFVKVASYGWDTHGDNFNASASLVPKFDRAFAAIVEDLAASGLLETTLVIAMSEFGRTPRINGHVGRDHWPEAWSIAMAGCGLKAGAVVGATNDKGTDVKDKGHDIGAVFHTWFNALGIDPKKTEYNNNGQPLPLAHEDMQPIKEALA